MKEEYILKERLQELIGNSRVEAALFYTYNFDPRFFENYIMPLLVPEQPFGNNAIVNNIIWRKLYKEEIVPNITVYCDQYAKSLEAGPMLDYKIVEVNMPSVGKNKGNFHPKQSFILLNNNGDYSMILITGSNNITQGGWCENKECISELILRPSAFFPSEFKKQIQTYIDFIVSSYGNNVYSAAEEKVIKFLNKRGKEIEKSNKSIYFYDSFQGGFNNFLEEYIFENDKPTKVEIISPYFKNDNSLVQYFINKGMKVNIQAPLRNGYCLLEETTYDNYAAIGARWYYPESIERNIHSKVYRLYSQRAVYTFIGSVNFTGPAWCGLVSGKKGIYNIESGVLYVEKQGQQNFLLNKEIKDTLSFLSTAELDEENTFVRENAPSIQFTINWVTSTIKWKAKLKCNCQLVLPGGTLVALNNSGSFDFSSSQHGANILQSLSRRTILEVVETVNDEQRTHYYFPNQEGFEQKPIEYRLSATDIIDAWDLLHEHDEVAREWLVTRLEQLTASAQDESGNILQQVSEHKSLLNEMARHLYGLVQLERFLFDEKVFKTKRDSTNHGKSLKYYLTHDNVDTLISYLKDLEKLYKEEKLLPGYYWLLLSIIQSNIYKYQHLKKFMKECFEVDERKVYQNALNKVIEGTETKLQAINSRIVVDKKKLSWVLENIDIYASNK